MDICPETSKTCYYDANYCNKIYAYSWTNSIRKNILTDTFYFLPDPDPDPDCNSCLHPLARCLPSCSDYEFPTATSFSRLTNAGKVHLPERIGGRGRAGHLGVVARPPEYSNDTYVRDNLAVLHIYFRWQGIYQ